jgi:hypothetical protein
MEPVKIALAFFVLLASGVVILLWRNTAAPDSLQNTGILIAGLLPALVAILPYLAVNKDSREFKYFLFFDESAKKAIMTGMVMPPKKSGLQR